MSPFSNARNPRNKNMNNRMKSVCITMLAAAVFAVSAGCTVAPPRSTIPASVAPHIELQSGNIDAMNYSSDLVVMFGIEGPAGTGIGGGGGNVQQIKSNGQPSTSGGSCCTSLPAVWQPELKLTVRWLAYMDDGNKVAKSWYKAQDVRIPKYDGRSAGTTWVIFLPEHRVRVMEPDGIDPDGGNNPDIRPAENDPFIAQGLRDEEANKLYLNNRKQ